MTFSDKLQRAYPYLMLCTYGVFMCGYFYFEDYSDHYRYFSRFVFLPGLFILAACLGQCRNNRLFQMVLVYLFYLLLSGLWSDPLDWYRLGQKITISLYLLGLIAITHYLVHWNRIVYERMLQLCVAVAAVAAAVTLLVFYQNNPFPTTRLVGTGSLTNVNEFSTVYGVFALLAMGFALRTRSTALRLAFLLAIGIFICYAWFGQSRTAIVVLILSLLAFIGLSMKRRGLLYATTLLGLVMALVIIFPDTVEQSLQRGKGLRPQIWAGVWDEAISAPIAGHGLVSQLSVKGGRLTFENAHNAYLQVFWHGGLIGLCLFLALLTVALRSAWSRARQNGDYTLLCILLFAACAMLTDIDTLIERPRDQWMIFWFPVALLISLQSKPSQASLVAATGNTNR